MISQNNCRKPAFSDNKADFKANKRGESMTQENKNTKHKSSVNCLFGANDFYVLLHLSS